MPVFTIVCYNFINNHLLKGIDMRISASKIICGTTVAFTFLACRLRIEESSSVAEGQGSLALLDCVLAKDGQIISSNQQAFLDKKDAVRFYQKRLDDMKQELAGLEERVAQGKPDQYTTSIPSTKAEVEKAKGSAVYCSSRAYERADYLK